MFCGQHFCMLNVFPLFKNQLVAFKCKQADIEYLQFKQSSNHAQLLRPAHQPVAWPGRWSWKWRCGTHVLLFSFASASCLALTAVFAGVCCWWGASMGCTVAGFVSLLVCQVFCSLLAGWLIANLFGREDRTIVLH